MPPGHVTGRPLPDRADARDDAHLIALWLAGCGSPHTQRAYVRDVAARLAWVPQSDRLAERILPEGDTLNLIHAAGAARPGCSSCITRAPA